jgi:hypothetical protein
MMSWLWKALIRNVDRLAGSAFAHSPFYTGTSHAMNGAGHGGSARSTAERRFDATSADIVQVGIYFVRVFGRNNAEAYFYGTDIAPLVYHRVIDGRYRRMPSGCGPASEPVAA